MARTSRHDGDGVSGNPGVIFLSEEEQAQIDALLTGGSFEGGAEPSAVEATYTQPLPVPAPSSENTVPATVPRPTPVPSPRPNGGSGAGSFGTPASRSEGAGTSTSQTSAGSTGTFGTPTGGGASGVRGSGKRAIRPGRSFSFGDLSSRLPELWGLDLALTLVTIAGIYMIVTNLQSILLAIANVIYILLNGAMEVGVFLALGAAAIWFVFGRRRRW